MKLRSFHLSVKSHTNDFGTDFLVVELNKQRIDEIRRLANIVKSLEVYAIHTFDHSPTWYRGAPEFVCEELFADTEGTLDRLAFIEEHIEEVRTEVNTLIITDDEVYWQAESYYGGNLYTSEPIAIDTLERRLGINHPLTRLGALVRKGMEFPDAVWKVSREYGLKPADVTALEADYDRSCVEG